MVVIVKNPIGLLFSEGVSPFQKFSLGSFPDGREINEKKLRECLHGGALKHVGMSPLDGSSSAERLISQPVVKAR